MHVFNSSTGVEGLTGYNLTVRAFPDACGDPSEDNYLLSEVATIRTWYTKNSFYFCFGPFNRVLLVMM